MASTQPPPAAAAAAAAAELIELIRRLRRRTREQPTGRLTPSQASVLVRLLKDAASTTTVLAIAEGVRPQSMTATLNALEDLGLIERRPDPEDGRRQIITLSAAGRRQAEEDRASRAAWLARLLEERLTEAQLRTVSQAVALLTDTVDGPS